MNDARLQLKALLPVGLRHQPWVDQLTLRVHDIPGRTLLFTPGQAPQHIYWIAKGWLASRIILGPDKTGITNIRLRGDMVGLNTLSSHTIINSAISLTKAELISVPRHEIESLLKAHPSLAEFIYREQARDIFGLQVFNTIIGQFKAPDRLACFLFIMFMRSQQSGRQHRSVLRIPLTQEEIGQLLGLTNVSVNRAFRTLESEGLIKAHRQMITLIDLEKLAKRGQIGQQTDIISLYFGKDHDVSYAA